MPFIGKADGNAVAGNRPQFLDQTIIQFSLPFAGEKALDLRQLTEYHWPGNVLELQKPSGRRAHPEGLEILTEEQMIEHQISNIIACLRHSGGRVSGENGAAALLGIKPTTLYSRIKKFEISPDLWR